MNLTNCNMNETEWSEMYRKLYDAYDYVGVHNEHIRKNLGEMIDYMIKYKQHFLKRPA